MEAHESFLSSRQGGGLGATREGTTTTTTTTKKKEILKLCSESLHRRRFEDVLTLTSGLFKKKNKKKEKKEEEKEKKAFQVCIHVARARAHASLQQFEECLKECNEILQMKPNLAVANWLKAKALIGLGGAYEARIYLYKCRRSLSISSNTCLLYTSPSPRDDT